MSSTRKSQAARYLTLLITAAALGVAIRPVTQRVRAVSASDTAANVQATSTRVRARYNGRLVFVSDRHSKALSIWTMNPDGSSPTRLTDDRSRTERLPSFVPVYDLSPAWSPDGTRVAFVSNRNGFFAIYTMNADGSNVQLVTDKVLDAVDPAWSPDGRKIAFSDGAGGTLESNKAVGDIYLVNLDGGGLTKLTHDSGLNRNPSWSPDGKQIAFSSARDQDGKAKIWVMNADGSNQKNLTDMQKTDSRRFHGGQPSWSPDGTKILFNDGNWLFVMNADGSNTRPLISDPSRRGIYSRPRWSPDGTKIVAGFYPEARNSGDPASEIVVMNADGSSQIKISNRGKYYLTSGLSLLADDAADWQPLSSSPDFASSVVGFSAPSFTVYEDAGSASITVRRTGNLDDVASCFYVTLTDPTMIKHYDPSATGILRFARGESSKTISIAIDNSRGARVPWSLRILLSDNEGNATFIGGIKEATLTILNKDTAPLTNPN